jgi:hypothetical protein
MQTPDWLRSWWAKVIGGLGVYGTLAGLGVIPFPATLLAVILGALSGQLALALAIALVVSLCINVFLVLAIRQRRWRHRGRSVGLPRPKALAVEGELDSIVLTSADFESWWANMLAVARERVGPDARAYVDSIHLDNAFIVFYGESPAALKAFSGTVAGPDPSHVSFYGVHRKDKAWDSDPRPPLWRTDDTWRELIKRAWLQERPVRSLCTLHPEGRGADRWWMLSFGPYGTDDERLVRGRNYRLVNGELVRRNDP